MKNEPEGGHYDTMIIALDSSGNHWPSTLEHNGRKYPIPKEGLPLHINGGSVRINGIEVTKKVQKGVKNIFKHSMTTGNMDRIEPKDGDNIIHPLSL